MGSGGPSGFAGQVFPGKGEGTAIGGVECKICKTGPFTPSNTNVWCCSLCMYVRGVLLYAGVCSIRSFTHISWALTMWKYGYTCRLGPALCEVGSVDVETDRNRSIYK